ncbi:MAG: Membrane associated chemotaxis sensory transducer protein [Leuconostoc sp. DORA_2]|nr:MAG: Membrane associated chemotaxis sensory transducer protein [Leuconostoc sp. DORA_2]
MLLLILFVKNSNTMYENNLQSIYLLADIKQSLISVKSDVIELVFIKNEDRKSDLKDDIQINVGKNNKNVEQYENLPMTQEEKK